MKTFAASVTMLLLLVLTSFKTGQANVYVCISSGSARYHIDRYCSGLKKCTHEIKAMSITEAQKMGKTPCHICAN